MPVACVRLASGAAHKQVQTCGLMLRVHQTQVHRTYQCVGTDVQAEPVFGFALVPSMLCSTPEPLPACPQQTAHATPRFLWQTAVVIDAAKHNVVARHLPGFVARQV